MTSYADNLATNSPSAAEIEQWLVALLAKHLKIATVDPLAPLGGYNLNSLSAMRLLHKLEQWLGESLPATLFFEYPNVRSISEAVASGTAVQRDDYVAPDEDCYQTEGERSR
jgi:acyl carrier protein